jgi:hypothetical protein
MNNDETKDDVKDTPFEKGTETVQPGHPPAWDEWMHEEAAEAADVGVKDSRYVDPLEDETWRHERHCDCPLCDSSSESGCGNKGTVLIGSTWMCETCANSVAAVQRAPE